MAITKTLTVRGRIGTVICYDFNGKNCVRRMPAEVKQTKATKQASQLFGRASKIAYILRTGLSALINEHCNFTARNRFNGAVLKWLHKSDGPYPSGREHLEGFEFNPNCHIRAIMKVALRIDWSINNKVVVTIGQIKIPRLSIPAGAHTLHLSIALAGCKLKDASPGNQFLTQSDIPLNSDTIPAQRFEIPVSNYKNELVVIVAGVQYSSNKKNHQRPITDLKWRPVTVVGAAMRNEQ